MTVVRLCMRMWQYCPPTLLLFGALVFLALLLRDLDAPVLIWTFIVAPPLAFGISDGHDRSTGAGIGDASHCRGTGGDSVPYAYLAGQAPSPGRNRNAHHRDLCRVAADVSDAVGPGVWLAVSDWWQRRNSGQTGHRSPGRLGS